MDNIPKSQTLTLSKAIEHHKTEYPKALWGPRVRRLQVSQSPGFGAVNSRKFSKTLTQKPASPSFFRPLVDRLVSRTPLTV